MKTGTYLFRGKNIYKNRLVCKNAVSLAYYGSCRLLVMAPARGDYQPTYQLPEEIYLLINFGEITFT